MKKTAHHTLWKGLRAAGAWLAADLRSFSLARLTDRTVIVRRLLVQLLLIAWAIAGLWTLILTARAAW